MGITREEVLRRLDLMCSAGGGVAAAKGKRADPMSTAQVAVLASDVSAVHELLRDRLPAVAAFLESEQQPDGRWQREGDDWHTSITGWVLLGLAATRTRSDLAVERGAAWLSARQTQDGGFAQSDTEEMPNTYSTSYATTGLAAVGGAARQVSRGIGWLHGAQDREGGFGDDYSVVTGSDPSLTAYVAHALNRLDDAAARVVVERCAGFIAATQRPSGAWPAWYEDADSIEGTAACMRVLLAYPGLYSTQITAGAAFLRRSVNITELENWIIVSLAYLYLKDPPHGLGKHG